jgi:glycosyltransferase involved in cell wall biosynthesis
MSTSISVVMTVYNGARFLAESVESVLNQTMPDFELIVVDDGSTDSSGEILERHARLDRRVKIIRQRHAGVPAAANLGIRHAKYQLIARTDCDDRMLPDRLERQAAFLRERQEIQLACSNCYFINVAGQRIGSSVCRVDVERARTELRPSYCLELIQSTVLMRKNAFLAAGGYREDLLYAEDRDLWGRFATSGVPIALQPGYLIEFRLHTGAMTMKKAALQHEICSYIDENVKRRFQGKPEISLSAFRAEKANAPRMLRLRENTRFMALHAFKRASRHYGEGQYLKCALSMAAAMSLNPAQTMRRVLQRIQIREASA